jgi:hypothetical protein
MNHSINGFTHLLNGDPIPPRRPPYVSAPTQVKKTKNRKALTIKMTEATLAFKKNQMSPPTKIADTNKSQALRMAGI